MNKRYASSGIGIVILYFLSVAAFLVTGKSLALTIWESMTMVSAPATLFLLVRFCDCAAASRVYRDLMLTFMACACTLTCAAHIVNISVTRRLLAQGVEVPTYFQIGMWPSVEMAIDYLAWGFFVGLAFAAVALSIDRANSKLRGIRITFFVNAALCLAGFVGAFLLHENLWYLAPLGYGIGFVVFCIQWLRLP